MTRLRNLQDSTETAVDTTKKVCFVVPGVNRGLEQNLSKIILLANLLADDQHDVSLALWIPRKQTRAACEALLRQRLHQSIDIHYIPVPDPRLSRGMLGMQLYGAYNTYAWLKNQDFDMLHFHDGYGLGYYCMVAKKAGVAFHQQLLSIVVDTPSLMDLEANQLPIEDGGLLVRYELEKRSLEMADQLLFLNTTAAEWMSREGIEYRDERAAFELPCFREIAQARPETAGQTPQRLVFWGELSTRSGFPLFCASLGRLRLKEIPVEVYCSSPERHALSFARHQLKRLGLGDCIFIGRDFDSTLKHLQDNDSLVFAMDASGQPTLEQIECLVRGIPVISLDCPQNRAIYQPDRVAGYLFEPRSAAIADLMERLWSMPNAHDLGAIDYAACQSAWRHWHRQVTTDTTLAPSGEQPKVSICLMHHERPKLVRQAIASVEAQTYPDLEVILLDDGSTSEAAVNELKRIEDEFKPRGWQVVVQENRYLGAARNTAVRHASGKYLFFLDDDNYLKPDAIEKLVSAAEHSGSDIVGSFSYSFRGNRIPDDRTAIRCLIGHMGAGIEFGLFKNPFADSNSLIRREFFNRIGGNTEDYGVGKDDQEFYARALLAKASMMVIPEPLYWARQLDSRLRHRHFNRYAGQWRVSRPYLARTPPELRNIIRFSQSVFNRLYVEPVTLAAIGEMIELWSKAQVHGLIQWAMKLMRKLRH